jgi:hypothetical protein
MPGITSKIAKAFDKLRNKFLGKGVKLLLLGFIGDGEYAVNKELSSGWLPERKTGSDGGIYTQVQIADLDGTLATAIDGTDEIARTTDFAIGTNLYKLEPEHTERPLMEPKIWILRGFDTGKTYVPEP